MSADPHVGPRTATDLPGRSRGGLVLFPERCTSCMACARECPTWCIDIDAHTETTPAATPRGRARSFSVLDRFAIDFGLCMYCGICVEVCPFDALAWAPQNTAAATGRDGLRHEQDRLASGASALSSPGVGPPPADPGCGNTRSSGRR